jgi:hypothetical protein
MTTRLSVGLLFILTSVNLADESPGHRTLYNSIELPAVWPPQAADFSGEATKPPYLVSPPKVISIDLGRQLFVDDFLIEQTTLRRTFHRPAYYADTPILKADQPWEQGGQGPFAAPFSDGVWYDAKDGIFKMWYYASHGVGTTCYATSKDGIRWEKPSLDVVPGTNIVLKIARDSGTVWIDPGPREAGEQYKMAIYRGGRFALYRSGDGIHWTPSSEGAKTGDRSTFFFNPFRQRWVFSIRSSSRFGRSRRYFETADFFRFSDEVKNEFVPWACADSADPQRDDLKTRPQLYNLDCAAYESVMVGLFSIWRGDYRSTSTEKGKELFRLGRPKQNSICVGFSRDGFHWDRPDREPFMAVSEKRGDWNWGNVQSTAPCFLVVGDELRFYVSGRAGMTAAGSQTLDAGASTGLATLRRDGFASMDAGEEGGVLITRPLRFSGKRLFVNVDAPGGELRAEVLDEAERVIAPFDRERCRPIRAGATKQQVIWEGDNDLSALAGRAVRLRFHLSRGRLYAFWITPDAGGASYGFLGGGGPGLAGYSDVPAAHTK